jgi:hypothetical protein
LTNQRPFESNPYLKLRGESQLRAKHAFERAAGWQFGLVFGALIILMAYVWDAAQIAAFHADFWWAKFALACVTILPLAVLMGGIAGYVNWLLKLPVWLLFGILAGWLAIHIPFDLSRAALSNFDANLRLVEYLPIPEAATDSFGFLGTLGAFLGILVGLAHTLLVNAAWERSTEDYKVTAGGWAMFLLSLPLAFAYAFLYDGTAHLPMRMPMERVNTIVQSGLTDPPGLDADTMEFHRALVYLTGQQWAKQFTPDYTMRIVSVEPTRLGEAYVDVTFSNGYNWRCRLTSFGEFAVGCTDLNAEYARYISEFVPRGSFRCADCDARVTEQAAGWRAENARPLTPSDRLSVLHGAGSSILVRVQSQPGNGFECLISGANPVIIEQCKNL